MFRFSQGYNSTKTPKKQLFKIFLNVRGIIRSISPPQKVVNIFHATIQKTASQWIKAVLSDRRVVAHTGLLAYPQQRYEWNEFQERFPRYTFVPGLYISYPSFEEIVKPECWKAFYVSRDPRNVVVSWYYSMLETHTVMGRVPKHREALRQMTFEEGIFYCIRELNLKFQFMRSWVYSSSDPNILIVRFEDLVSEPIEGFRNILNFCEIDIPDGVITEVLGDYSKEKMRKRDLQRREDTQSHYRREKTSWKEVFTEDHKRLFYSITGDLVDVLGYEK